jgi:hypothetical protein
MVCLAGSGSSIVCLLVRLGVGVLASVICKSEC